MRKFKFVLVFWISSLIFSAPIAAQELTYDRYGAVYDHQLRSSGWKNALTHFLVYPFELVRWPIDQTLIITEKYKLDDKFSWVYETIQDHGVNPSLNVIGFGSFGAGVDLDFVRLTNLKAQFPNSTVNGWINWSKDAIFEVGGKVGVERVMDTGFKTFGIFNYSDRPEEHFYGVGPHSSAGDGSGYAMEETNLEYGLGYSWSPVLSIDGKFAYQNININDTTDGGRGNIHPYFLPQTFPGLSGDELLTWGVELNHDSRNQKENSTRGGQERLAFQFVNGIAGSTAEYFKYQAEVSRYLTVGSERRVLAFHFYGEHNDETDDHDVPFHQLAKLGGYGSYPRLSHTLRGFGYNRFTDQSALLFNLEYRYTVWEYRDFKLDAVFFWDEGQVFGEFGNFELNNFRESYGLGFRASIANVSVISLELAHGDEGTNLYVKSKSPF